jgi:NRPS condensation-like uncharacterized protein
MRLSPYCQTIEVAVSSPSEPSLFPLPLAPFEEYMYVDDLPEYPAVGFIGPVFRGHFDRAALAAAFETAIRRHPLLQAFVEPAGGGRFQWIAADNASGVLEWIPPDRPLALTVPWQIDLRREVGMRVFLRESGEHTEMILENHHSCCDATGVAAFLTDMLETYAQTVAPESPKSNRPRQDPQRLRIRGRFGMTVVDWLKRLPKDFAASLAAVEFLGHRPVPVAPPGDARDGEAPRVLVPTVAAHAFSEEETARVRELKKEMNCSVNDLLLAALFLSLGRWNLLRRPETRKRVLRIMVPMSLRSAGDEAMTAANMVSYVYLDRRPHRFRSPRALIRSVRWEMGICKRWRAGLTLLQFIRLFRRLPGGLKRMLPEDRCVATTVLSNIGDLTRSIALPQRDGLLTAGNVVLERYDVLPPVRPLTSASFGVNTYAGRLCLAVHCDPHLFTPADAQELLGTFVGQITAMVEDPDKLALPDATGS